MGQTAVSDRTFQSFVNVPSDQIINHGKQAFLLDNCVFSSQQDFQHTNIRDIPELLGWYIRTGIEKETLIVERILMGNLKVSSALRIFLGDNSVYITKGVEWQLSRYKERLHSIEREVRGFEKQFPYLNRRDFPEKIEEIMGFVDWTLDYFKTKKRVLGSKVPNSESIDQDLVYTSLKFVVENHQKVTLLSYDPHIGGVFEEIEGRRFRDVLIHRKENVEIPHIGRLKYLYEISPRTRPLSR